MAASVAVAVWVPVRVTHVTATLSPGLWALTALPSVVTDVTAAPPTDVITEPCVMPAASAGDPG